MSTPLAKEVAADVARCYELQKEYVGIGNVIKKKCESIETKAKARAEVIFAEELPGTKVTFHIDTHCGCLSLEWKPRLYVYDIGYKELSNKGFWVREDFSVSSHRGWYYKVKPPVTRAKLKQVMARIKDETGLQAQMVRVTVTQLSQRQEEEEK